MNAEPIARLDKCDVWFVASNETWTAEQTRDAFAMQVGPEPPEGGTSQVTVTLHGKDGFSLDCLPGRVFRTSLVALDLGEWAFAVMEDRD